MWDEQEGVMPVEYVRSSENLSEESEVLVKVAWGREYVQVASVGRATVTHDALEIPEGDGWYVTLDRRGINELIRNLRRARDRAYGRDE
jgi:hypothetical protein